MSNSLPSLKEQLQATIVNDMSRFLIVELPGPATHVKRCEIAKRIAAVLAPEPRKDQCEVCEKPLPHVDEWSMPSCPDCQEVLEFLGELQADYADREREGKADLVGSAIKLICRQTRASQPPADVARDAERYRRLRNQDIERVTFPRPGVFIGRTMPDEVLTHEDADMAVDAMKCSSVVSEPCHECGGDHISRRTFEAFKAKEPCASCTTGDAPGKHHG